MGICQYCGREYHAGLRMHEKFCALKHQEENKEDVKTEVEQKELSEPEKLLEVAKKELKKPAAPKKTKKETKPEEDDEDEQEQLEKQNWTAAIIMGVIAIVIALVWVFHAFILPPEEEK